MENNRKDRNCAGGDPAQLRSLGSLTSEPFTIRGRSSKSLSGGFHRLRRSCLGREFDRCGGIDEAWPVVVGYSGSPKGVGPFACYVTQNLHLQKPMVQAIGTVIGTHAGPGACGIAFFANEPFPGETE